MALKNIFSNGYNAVNNNLRHPEMLKDIPLLHKGVPLLPANNKKHPFLHSAPPAVKER